MPVTKDEIFGETAEPTGFGGLGEPPAEDTSPAGPARLPAGQHPTWPSWGAARTPCPPARLAPRTDSSTAQLMAPHQLCKALPDSHGLLKNIKKKKKKKTNGPKSMHLECIHCFNLLQKGRDTPAPCVMLGIQVKKALKV